MWLRSVGAVCAVAMALAGAEPAQAQDYGTIVVFGDSLSDDGNLFAVSGGTTPASPPYFDGRFSNGPVWVERLAGYSSALNFAYGGAHTDDTNNADPLPGALGVQEQIDQYLGSTGGTVQPGSLVVLWAGANDINAALGSGNSPITAAQVAAQNQIGNLTELVQAGADTVLLPNLPNLGATPGAIGAGIPGLQQLLLFSTATYNQTLDAGVRSLPLPAGTNIIQMDVFSAFNVILADPAAFGFTNVTQACLAVTACRTSPAVQNQFLFWDNIHPTAAGHALLAQYAGLLLSTGTIAQAVAPLAEASFQARLESSQAAFGRTLNALAFPDFWRGGIFAEVIGNRFNGDGSGGVSDYRQDLAGVRAGVEGRIGGAIAGVAVSYAAGEHDQGGLSADTERAQADIYGTMRLGGFFVGADAGVSYSNYRNIDRDTGFPTVTADGDTDGWGYSAAVNAGYVIGQGAFKLLPNVRLGYLSSSTDAFSESAPLLALEYGDRDISSGFWSAGVRAATTLDLGGRPLQAFGEIGYEGLFATSTDDVTAHLVGNTALPVSAGIDDPAARGLYLRVGVDGQLNETTTLSLDYGVSLGDGDAETHSGKVAVKFLFGG